MADTPDPTPSPTMTAAFNALYVKASRELEGGIGKVSFLQSTIDAKSQIELTTPAQNMTYDNYFSAYQPYTLQFIIENKCFEIDTTPIIEEAKILLELHRDNCPHTVDGENLVIHHDSRECYSCHRIVAEPPIWGPCEGCGDMMELNEEFASWCCAECAEPTHTPTFNDESFTSSQTCICADCGDCVPVWFEDESTRLEGHCGCWADCEECGTITGVESCPCDKARITPKQAAELVVCCDWHRMKDHDKTQPCATHQGGSNFAPVFENSGDSEAGEWDFENELFASHIHHLVDASGENIGSFILRWESLDCPACGCRIEFENEGDQVRADCEDCETGSTLRWLC